MIAGLVALFTLLVLGGPTDYFLVADLDKGVKKYVVQKEIKKEILADFKESKKELKSISRERKEMLKELKIKLLDINTSEQILSRSGADLSENFEKYQSIIIDTRVRTLSKLTNEEWQEISEFSVESTKKKQSKIQAKVDNKGIPDPFKKVESIVEEADIDETHKKDVLEALESLRLSFGELVDTLSARNIKDAEVLRNKDTSKEELEMIAEYMRELKSKAFNDMIEFRAEIKNRLPETEFLQINNSVFKLINDMD